MRNVTWIAPAKMKNERQSTIVPPPADSQSQSEPNLDRPSPLMGWSGRAPAPPAINWPGAPRQGARHVSDTQYRDRRDRHRYRQELVPRRGPRYARRHRAAAKVVAWPSGGAARQYTAFPDRHGSLRGDSLN